MEKQNNNVFIIILIILAILISFGGGFILGKFLGSACITDVICDPCPIDNNTMINDNQLVDDDELLINEPLYVINIDELNAELNITNEDCQFIAKTPSEEGVYEVICRNMDSYGRAIIFIDPLITGGGFGLQLIGRVDDMQDPSFLDFFQTDSISEYEILNSAFATMVNYGHDIYDEDLYPTDLFTSSNFTEQVTEIEVLEHFYYNSDDSKPVSDLMEKKVILGFEIVAMKEDLSEDQTISPLENMYNIMKKMFTVDLVVVE